MRGLPHCGRNLWPNSHAGISVFWALLIIAVAWTYARFLNRPGGRSEKPGVSQASSSAITAERAVSPKTEFGEFQPGTEAERELEKMLRGRDKDIDLAVANWLVAEDVPQFANLTRAAYFDRLDAMTQQVRREMTRRAEVAKFKARDPNAPDTRCAIFCGAMIDLGFTYRREFAQHELTPLQMRALYADANNIILAGLLRTMKGSCVSMPLIYVVIGQRLGLPVHLVHVGKHTFARWQEPGYRMNIETTAVDKVWVTEDDTAYLEQEGMKREQVSGNELRNLSRREVIGTLLFIRSSHWVMKAEQEHGRSWADIERARHLSPEDPAIASTHRNLSRLYAARMDPGSAEVARIESALSAPIGQDAALLPPPFGIVRASGTGLAGPDPQAHVPPCPVPDHITHLGQGSTEQIYRVTPRPQVGLPAAQAGPPRTRPAPAGTTAPY